MTAHALAAQAVLEQEWGEAVDEMLDGVQPGAAVLAPSEAKAALEQASHVCNPSAASLQAYDRDVLKRRQQLPAERVRPPGRGTHASGSGVVASGS